MKKEVINQKTVITANGGEITEISSPENVNREIMDLLYKDFNSDVNGLMEHYIAVAVNYTDEKLLNEAIKEFNA